MGIEAGEKAGEGARSTRGARAARSTRAIWGGVMRESKTTSAKRAFRVQLRGAVLILVRLPNGRRVRAALHTLSTTGGVIQLEKPLDEKIEVELLFHVDCATIRGKGEMLFPMWATQGWLQPFRFVDLPEASRKGLETNLKSFLDRVNEGAAAGQ
jgi:hypothetical protein